MFYRWTRPINGAVLFLLLLGSMSLLSQDPVRARSSKSDNNFLPSLQATPGIYKNSAQNLLFLPVATNLGFHPPIEIIKSQTEDGAKQAKSIFLPGEDIAYRIAIANNTSKTKSVAVRWTEVNSCGVSPIIDETVRIQPGKWEKLIPATTPDCQGLARHVIEAVDGNETIRHSFEHIITTPFQGFDKCTLPSVAQMQTWWNSSPYWSFNVYIGGVSLACRDSNLNINWLRSVSRQGWTFVPTWVGLQAPCSRFDHRMSANPATARQQGRNEADAAAGAASQLGLLGNRVIYYDIEGYSSRATDSCRQAVTAFMQGWVERLHELGFSAGAYGGACSSFAADWAENTIPPDNVWLAHWFRSSWYKYASVWNTPCIANELWANHQRLKQYAGDHNETWGGVTFRIDSNVLDGTVASFQEIQQIELSSRTVVGKPGYGKDSQDDAIKAMQLLAPGSGWALSGERLFVTESGGGAWQDVTPAPLLEGEILGVYFKDPDLGWLAGFTPDLSGEGELILLRTEDGGLNWSQIASPLPTQEISSIAAIYPYFLDAQTGWIAMKLQSSSNFSLGRLFSTQDGGQTWEELALPLGEPVKFLDSGQGWIAGGPRSDQLFWTEDGGRSWRLQSLPPIPAGSADQIYLSLPLWTANLQGFLPVTVSGPTNSKLLLFTTPDRGKTWKFFQLIELASQAGQPVLFSLLKDGLWWAAGPGSRALITNSFNESVVVQTVLNLTGNIIAIDFISSRNGWKITQAGECTGEKLKLETASSTENSAFICHSTSILWATEDAGRTWKDITPHP